MTIKLYRFVPYDRSGRVAWLLHEMDVDFAPVEVDARRGEHMEEEFRALNPVGRVPVVVDGSQVVFESGAALQWLADRYGSGELAPTPNAEERAEYLSWMYFAAATLDPAFFPFVNPLLSGDEGDRQRELANQKAPRLLDAVDRRLRERSTVLDGGFSAADILLASTLDYADAGGCLEDYERLRSYLDEMRNRPGARAVEAFGGQ